MTKFRSEETEINQIAEIIEDDEITVISEQDERDQKIEELRERLARLEELLENKDEEGNKKIQSSKFIISKSPLYTNNRGIESDDLNLIASHLSINTNQILNGEWNGKIRVKNIKIKHGAWIDFIQFTYKVKHEKQIYEITGYGYGNKDGGHETFINLAKDEVIILVRGLYGENNWYGNVDQLEIHTQKKIYGPYAGAFSRFSRRININASTERPFVCFFGKHNSSSLNGLGMYKGWNVSN